MERTPGNIPRIIAILINGLRTGNRMQLIAYATISTNNVEITQVAAPIIREFRNQAGKLATVSGRKNNCM